MLSTKEFKAGRIYTVVYSDDSIEMKKSVRLPERAENPFAGNVIGVRRVARVQAAGPKTWANIQKRKNPDWQPSADYSQWWHELAENRCIVEHNREATRYLRGIPKGIVSEVYTIDGKLATPAQVETIRKFKKNSGGDEFCLLNLDKLENVLDETGEDE